MPSKVPRLDPYARILHRFFETLFLLSHLSRAQGPHRPIHWNLSQPRDIRRRYLSNLAFLCDYSKGGHTTTSIAVEERSDCYLYWVATNDGDGDGNKVSSILKKILTSLHDILHTSASRRETLEEKLVDMCAQFAQPRVKKEAKMGSNAAKTCIRFLSSQNHSQGDALIDWLDRFNRASTRPPAQLCRIAYELRNDDCMLAITRLGRDPTGDPRITSAFRHVRHHIGRLASRVKAVHELIQDSGSVYESLTIYRVETVPMPECVAPPQADAHTNLEGIRNRMLRRDDPRIESIRHNLQIMEGQIQLEDKIRESFADKNFIPQVHAEVQMLEHFHRGRRRFAFNDRFIACSKAACLCCKLYIRHHPLRVVEPPSHETIYRNWGPVLLLHGAADADWPRQRQMLQRIIEDMREIALDYIEQQLVPGYFHANSLTNITALEDPDFWSSSSIDGGNTSDEEAEVFQPYGAFQPEEADIGTSGKVEADNDETDSSDDSDGGVAI